ncbi:class I SAM-dependent DNA methyltransferase [Pseudodesulfovibrio sp.]|uniref:class I SAM-dependent DNA methyltransferase n=1 Tax=unclassified Pseudodesulfovibrio TaxID=2661612 RepID=UPI003B001B50
MVCDNKTLDKVYTATNHADLMDAYKDWACNYENDTVGEFGYVAPQATANAASRVIPDTKAEILDAGCGTGLVGKMLKSMNYERIDALDYSRDMLREAENKGVYDNLMQADLSKPLDLADDSYDAVTCCGTFTYGHVDANGFDELIRITRPGGHICFTVQDGAYRDGGYRARMVALEKAEAWELVSMENADYLKNEGIGCKLCTYKVLAEGAASAEA